MQMEVLVPRERRDLLVTQFLVVLDHRAHAEILDHQLKTDLRVKLALKVPRAPQGSSVSNAQQDQLDS